MPILRSRAHVLGAILLALPVRLVFGLEEATGVNLTADESFGARRQGFALMRAGFETSSDAAINAPASMNDVNDLTFSSGHAERFGAADFDCASLLIPVDAYGTLGFGLARYAVGGIEIRPAGAVQATDPELFTAADWMVSGSFSRRLGGLDLGGTLHVLYRKLDQDGYGLRADAMAQYTFIERFRVGAFLRGLVPSISTWESGYSEYEPSDLLVFSAARWALPYFYGNLQAGWESPGLFQLGGKSSRVESGRRAFTNPGELFAASNLGAEFLFDFGLSLRAGLEGLDPKDAEGALRMGVGYNWRNIVGVDYAYSSHPRLSNSHRVAIRLTPSFPRFEGRGFRPKAKGSSPAPSSTPMTLSPESQPMIKALPPGERNTPTPKEDAEILEED